MSRSLPRSTPLRALAGLATLAVAGGSIAGLTVVPASANPAGTGLVISEAYGGGGNSGATYTNDFVELYNPTSAPISVAGMSVQYRSSTGAGAGAVTPLTGSVPAGGHYLVQEAAGTGGTDPLPTPDATGTIAMGAGAFTVWLASGTTALTPPTGNAAGTAGVLDLVGVNSNTYEGTKAAAAGNTTSASRNAAGADTDVNATDLTIGAPTPQGTASTPPPPPVVTTVDKTIAEIQGTGDASPFAGDKNTYVRTRGVVTAAYPTGGFYAFVIQTPGTGTGTDATPGASDALYVFQKSGGVAGHVGDYVEVTGLVSEFNGLTELTYDPSDSHSSVTQLTDAHDPVTALAGDLPTTTAAREAHESELLDLSGQHFTVSNNYSLNQYAEIGLATGDTPLVAPTEEYDAQDTAAIAAATAANAARAITLDDGSSTNFLPFGGGPAQDVPLPWLSPTNTVRVSSAATFRQPVVLDYRNSTWKLQPTHQVTDTGADVVAFTDTRAENMAPQDVGGDLRLATSNVLNFFNTTGEAYVAAGGSCTYYVDRDDNPVTDNTCTPNGPRGAAQSDDLVRQRDKIVAAINTLDADIVSLEEVENSVALGESNRDDALSDLVDHLNAAAGTTRWAYVPSPDAADLPPLAEQDVIRTAFIYDPSTVQPVGASKVLVGSAAFGNAREPLAQAFKPKGAPDSTTFGVIVNHFKSKGSGVDDGTGQGNANPDRVAQADALAAFADQFTADRGISKLFLTGDFNAYSHEDPVQELESKGYTNLHSDQPDEYSYNYGGMDGSLDHVFANAAALADVTGVDIWNNNADESVAWEYSRTNYNVTDFYQPNQFRASDHDPEVIGIDVPGFPAVDTTTTVSASPMTYGTDGRVDVRVASSDATSPTGTVTLLDGTRELGSAPVGSDGTAAITVPGTALQPGSHDLTVDYSGDDGHHASSAPVTVTVAKASPTMGLSTSPGAVVERGTDVTLTVRLTAPQQTVTGWVYVHSANGDALVRLVDGVATVDLGTFKKAGSYPVSVVYSGSDLATPVSGQTTVTVVKR
ncbi:MAG: ExeM/NucH family extracellular endonuclease [Nocardioides sp.]